eukprot:Skav208203  [mRNA]  locus=scaffold2026:167899:172464:+ [translate_table: standard]
MSDKELHPNSLLAWVNGVLRLILESRTSFGAFVSASIRSCRGSRHASSSALFPIPLPVEDVWRNCPRLGKERREKLAVRKALHLCIMALNYTYLASPFASLEQQRRCPGPAHLSVFKRLTTLIKAGGPSGLFSTTGCGRKSFQLDARLGELLKMLETLGLSNGAPYNEEVRKTEVPLVNDIDELIPYRCLDPLRLKLSGEGHWDCRPYLSDLLYLPFVEPRVNMFKITPPRDVLPDFASVKRHTLVELCKVWDAKGLLRIYPWEYGPKTSIGCTKVFNNFKNALVDRQIGDRRSQNYMEGQIPGPSRDLPSGVAILQLAPERYHEQVLGCVADRRDFYHQFAVSEQRATTNCLFPFLSCREVAGLNAFKEFEMNYMRPPKRKRYDRAVSGDHLGGKPRSILVGSDSKVQCCFAAFFQGDHLGVEFATEAHGALLQEYGLLQRGARFLGTMAIAEDRCVSGLVIDDFFSLSCEPLGLEDIECAQSVQQLRKAKEAYRCEKLQGSDDKDVVAASKFKVVGAEVISDRSTVERGACVVGAPFEKRLGLGYCSAVLAALGWTSDALHASLVGSWVSVLTFRRQAMALVNQLFHVIPPAELDTEHPLLRKLGEGARCELQVLACLSPVLASNIAVPFLDEVFATDASSTGGGITVAHVDQMLAKVLWRTADRKGANVPLMSRAKAMVSCYDTWFEDWDTFEGRVETNGDEEEAQVERPLGLRFQFLEICGGAGKVSACLADLGVVCGPVFDLSFSKQYNLADSRIIQWCIFMLEQDRLDSFLVSPPCTTFSCAAYPPVRSYRIPRGFNPRLPKTWIGNRLAFAAITLLFVALRLHKIGMGEQPRRSKMRWLSEWKMLLVFGALEAVVASCAYGSIHQKEFCFIGANMKMQMIHAPCTRDHPHVPIQGAYTKPSATYTDGLALALAKMFKAHLDARARAVQRTDLDVAGLEDVLSNDISATLDWEVHAAWKWKGNSHINLLEAASTVKLYRDVAARGGDCRFTYLGDSHVARSSLARGRSSSSALRSQLKQSAGLCIAYGLYPAGRFTPTRINPGDFPSRDLPLPSPSPLSLREGRSALGLTELASLPPLRRWASNWLRLLLLLSPKVSSLCFENRAELRRSSPFPVLAHEWSMDFDATLGYPGEGPLCSVGVRLAQTFLIVTLAAAVPRPSHGDEMRRMSRAGITLGEGRRVTETTAFTRDWLFNNFVEWLGGQGFSVDEVVFGKPLDVDHLNKCLCDYGRWLFGEGKPYYHFAETINSISTRRPAVRRSLQQSWDLAFMWGSHEPTTHHVAMPIQVLVAVISVAWTWGWAKEAAIFALAWGALLRIGEIFQAVRADLILPSDIEGTISYILLRIREPKTRFRAARHQAGKVEQPDLIEVIRIGFQDVPPVERLWPLSPSTLRHRLSRILERLCLPCQPGDFPKPLTLASFRPGGATWLIVACEDASLVQRRGRWVSGKTMECYLQEVAASTYMNEIDKKAKELVLQAFKAFPSLLKAIVKLHALHIPESSWWTLLSKGWTDRKAW